MKSVLRSKFLLVAALGCLSLAAAAVSDRLLFRVNQTVVGVHDLENAQADLAALECRFPDSLLLGWLGDKYLPRLRTVTRELAASKDPLAGNQAHVIFLGSVTRLWKVLLFADTQDVAVRPELERKITNVPGCPSILFAKKDLRESFRRWLRLEIYLRSRYAPGGMSDARDWREKRVSSIEQFADSIDKQLAHENFW